MKMKKLLASALAATMVLSSMVGAMVTSAATSAGTITAGTVNAYVGETDSVKVPVTINFDDGVVAPHNLITVALEGYNVTNVEVGAIEYLTDAQGKVTFEGLENGKILLEAPVDETAPTVKSIALTVTFEDADDTDTAADEYEIVVNGDEMTNFKEDTLELTAENGKLIVTEKHVHSYAEKVTDPTCTEKGYTTYTCTCNDSYVGNYVDALGHNYVDGVCDRCGVADPDYVPECDHAGAVATVTTQPTKDVVGTMTYTCECGHTWTEEIAKPTATTAVTFKGDIVVSSVVGTNFTISTKQMRTAYGDNASYFIIVDYKKYGSGDNLYMLEDAFVKYDDSDKIVADSTANKSIVRFAEGALSEMTLDYTATIYFVNGDGIVVGYREFTTNIAAMAKVYCDTYSTNKTLLTAMADMCAYADEAISYFASSSPNTDICNAVMPSTILGEANMAYKSTTDGMPAAGEYNNDKLQTKIVSTTGFISGGQSLVIGSSNQISYTLRYDKYDWENVKIIVHYEDSINGHKEFVVSADELIADGLAGNGQPKFKYYFKDLALYDCDKTVTMDMYYNGVKELTSVYSFGNFVNANLSNASLAPLLTTMELFSNSIGVQLGLDARW